MNEPSPIRTIVSCLARIAVEEYLTAEAARLKAEAESCPNPVPLPDQQKAA